MNLLSQKSRVPRFNLAYSQQGGEWPTKEEERRNSFASVPSHASGVSPVVLVCAYLFHWLSTCWTPYTQIRHHASMHHPHLNCRQTRPCVDILLVPLTHRPLDLDLTASSSSPILDDSTDHRGPRATLLRWSCPRILDTEGPRISSTTRSRSGLRLNVPPSHIPFQASLLSHGNRC